MQIKFLRAFDHDLPMPEKDPDDAGYDLMVAEDVTLFPRQVKLVHSGWKCAIPKGYYGAIKPRSGRGHKEGLVLGNLEGVIDPSYRGEIMISLWNRKEEGEPLEIKKGERVCQMIITPYGSPIPKEVDDLDETERSSGGFGSTGN